MPATRRFLLTVRYDLRGRVPCPRRPCLAGQRNRRGRPAAGGADAGSSNDVTVRPGMASARAIPAAPACPPAQVAPPSPASRPPRGDRTAGASLNLTQRGVPAEASAENGVLAKEQGARRRPPRRLGTELLSEAGTTGPTTCPTADRRSGQLHRHRAGTPLPHPLHRPDHGRSSIRTGCAAQLGGRVPGLAPARRPGAARRPPAARPRIGWMPSPPTVPWRNGSTLVRRLQGRGAGRLGRYPGDRGGCGAAPARAAARPTERDRRPRRARHRAGAGGRGAAGPILASRPCPGG